MNRLAWKRRFGRAFSHRASASRDIVLLYHSVGGGPWSVPSQRFVEQLEWLAEHAQVIPLDRLLGTPNPDSLRAAITFDDGYLTLKTAAHGPLRAHQFPATVYLTTGMLGNGVHLASRAEWGHNPSEQFLSWEDVYDLAGSGWTCGGHGIDHINLTRVARAEVDRQLLGCKRAIETELGVKCDHFAYTWGRHNRQVREAVSAAGFRTGAAGVHGPVNPHSARLAFPRVDIRAEYQLEDFINVVTGAWDYLGVRQRILHALA